MTTQALAKQILISGKELIAEPVALIKGYMAKDVNDLPCPAMSDQACKFCPMGAVYHASYLLLKSEDADLTEEQIYNAESRAKAILRLIRPDTIMFNDSANTGHSDAIDLFDRAIALSDRL